jgi:uridine kinase
VQVDAATVRRIVAALRAAPPRAGRTRVLAVDGPSAAGKTVLAGALAAALGGVPVVHLDDFYPGWDGLADGVTRLRRWVLEPLAAGRPAGWRRYDWVAGRDAEWHPVPSAPVLVVEGCGAGARVCAPYLSLLVWVEAPADVRWRRAMARDGDAYRPYWERWRRQEDALYGEERTRERADVFVRTG